MEKKQCRKAGNPKNQSASPPPKEHSSSPATEQTWTENDFDEMREGFGRSTFSELKEELRNQCEETKNLEKRMDEWITRIINAEKTLKELIEMKTITQELHNKYTSFSN
uniref:Uncharacterized protein n=1 Tax=Macaca fascicularis TaxID=9541 RepID=A0A7N9ID28_MACFA